MEVRGAVQHNSNNLCTTEQRIFAKSVELKISAMVETRDLGIIFFLFPSTLQINQRCKQIIKLHYYFL